MEQSPCVRICTLNADSTCIGCGRNAYEIQHWANFSDEIKRNIKSKLKDRLDEILVKISKQKE